MLKLYRAMSAAATMNRTTLPVKWIIYGLDSNIYLECFLGFLFDNCKEVKQYNSLYSNAEAVQSHVCSCQHKMSRSSGLYDSGYVMQSIGTVIDHLSTNLHIFAYVYIYMDFTHVNANKLLEIL